MYSRKFEYKTQDTGISGGAERNKYIPSSCACSAVPPPVR